jgi:hypothetical protein
MQPSTSQPSYGIILLHSLHKSEASRKLSSSSFRNQILGFCTSTCSSKGPSVMVKGSGVNSKSWQTLREMGRILYEVRHSAEEQRVEHRCACAIKENDRLNRKALGTPSILVSNVHIKPGFLNIHTPSSPSSEISHHLYLTTTNFKHLPFYHQRSRP